MLSHFTKFYLNKILDNLLQEAVVAGGGPRKHVTKAKGKAIPFDQEDKRWLADVYKQIIDQYQHRRSVKNKETSKFTTPISGSKIMMVRYQLLGDEKEVRDSPDKTRSEENKPFAWIENRSDEDSEGNIHVTVAFRGAGRHGHKTEFLFRASVVTNIRQLKEKVKNAGFDPADKTRLRAITGRHLDTWARNIPTDRNAAPGSEYPFGKLVSFSPDYHVNVEAENPDFNKRFQGDKEFHNTVGQEAVLAAARVLGFSVTPHGGFNYQVNSTKGRKLASLSENDLDDAIQSAIEYLRNHSAADPTKLNDSNWRKSKLKSGAMSVFNDLRRNREFAYGSSPSGNDDSSSYDVEDKQGREKGDDAEVPERDSNDFIGSVFGDSDDIDPTSKKWLKSRLNPEERERQRNLDAEFGKSLDIDPAAARTMRIQPKKKYPFIGPLASRDTKDPLSGDLTVEPDERGSAGIKHGDFASFGPHHYEEPKDDNEYEPDPFPHATRGELSKRNRWRKEKRDKMLPASHRSLTGYHGLTSRLVRGEAKKYSFGAFLERKLDEIGAATGIVFTGEPEGKDWQYEGEPDSMIKPRRKKKHNR